MHSVDDARNIIRELTEPLDPVQLPIDVCAGYRAAMDVIAPGDHPGFDQSAMDGYAIRFSDWQSNSQFEFRVVDEIAAGDFRATPVNPGEAVRIFTGAPVPDGADTVVMQEVVSRMDDHMRINVDRMTAGDHIRKRGEQVRTGESVLTSGAYITAHTIAYLAMLGIESIFVTRKPRVKMMITGSELVPPGQPLLPGQIYESNGIMMSALLNPMKIKNSYQHIVDDADAISTAIQAAVPESEMIIITGGVSVGNYDFTRTAFEQAGFEIILHGVRQKPGKPILVAQKGDTIGVGVPGNPRSALICFYQYIRPILEIMSGSTEPFLPEQELPLANSFRKRPDGKTYFLNARVNDDFTVDILNKQQSHMLQTMVEANAIAVVEADDLAAGDRIRVQRLPIY